MSPCIQVIFPVLVIFFMDMCIHECVCVCVITKGCTHIHIQIPYQMFFPNSRGEAWYGTESHKHMSIYQHTLHTLHALHTYTSRVSTKSFPPNSRGGLVWESITQTSHKHMSIYIHTHYAHTHPRPVPNHFLQTHRGKRPASHKHMSIYTHTLHTYPCRSSTRSFSLNSQKEALHGTTQSCTSACTAFSKWRA